MQVDQFEDRELMSSVAHFCHHAFEAIESQSDERLSLLVWLDWLEVVLAMVR